MTHRIISDGSSGLKGDAGSATILRIEAASPALEGLYLKLVAFLGAADSAESELFGGIVGLSAMNVLRERGRLAPGPVCWVCDHAPSREAVDSLLERWQDSDWQRRSGAALKHLSAWRLFSELSRPFELSAALPKGKSCRDHLACDRASRWVSRDGPGLLSSRQTRILGRAATQTPHLAWWLFDAREVIEKLRQNPTSLGDVSKFLSEQVSVRIDSILRGNDEGRSSK
jgi:ribonuclease HI